MSSNALLQPAWTQIWIPKNCGGGHSNFPMPKHWQIHVTALQIVSMLSQCVYTNQAPNLCLSESIVISLGMLRESSHNDPSLLHRSKYKHHLGKACWGKLFPLGSTSQKNSFHNLESIGWIWSSAAPTWSSPSKSMASKLSSMAPKCSKSLWLKVSRHYIKCYEVRLSHTGKCQSNAMV